MTRCVWHPKRRALVCGTLTRLGYCRACWGRGLMCAHSVVGQDATLWLAA